MQRIGVFLVLTVGLLGYFSPPVWAEVYKWVDQDGNVHYGDKPPEEGGKQKTAPQEIHVATPQKALSPDSAVVEKPEDRLASQKQLLNAMEAEREQKQVAEKESAQEKRKNERNCVHAKDALRSYQEAGYLYDVDKTGERVVLSDEKRRAAQAQAQARVDKWCNAR